MALIDKESAEKAFKNQKKELDTFLKDKGFVKYQMNSYVRLNNIGVEELGYIVSDFRGAGFSDNTIEIVLEQQYRMLDELKVPYERISI